MERIYLDDIDLCRLSEIRGADNKESVLFHDKNTVYKIFNDLHDYERTRKQTKIELLGDGLPLPITVMPKEELVYGFLNNRFEGNTMDYITASKTLYQAFVKNKNLRVLLPLLIRISKSLEEIHSDPRNIVISDLHAENIIVDKNYNPYIVDIDSCKIDGIKNDAIPMTLKHYLLNRQLFRSIDETETTTNTDRLCFLMMVLGLIFNKHIDRISMHQYDEVAERIVMLQTMRELVLEIKKSTTIPEVPYFHEIVKEDDLVLRRTRK